MKILWVQHASDWVLFDALALPLKERGADSVFVCKTVRAYEELTKRGHEVYSATEVFDDESLITEEEIAELDARYGPPGIKSMCVSDVHFDFLFQSCNEAKKRLVARTYRYWEHFFDTHEIDAVVARETAQFLTRTAYTVARARNIPFFIFAGIPVPDSFVLFDRGETLVWSELHERLAQGAKSLSLQEKRKVNSFLEARIPNMSVQMPVEVKLSSFITALRQYAGLVWYDVTQKRDPVYVAALRYGKYRLHKKLVWKYITQTFLEYDVPDEKDVFVYFPIYSGLEASYLVRTPFWARHEVDLIKEVAKRLPEGVFLYVKEHPTNPGDLTYRDLKELRRIANIKVIQPHVSSQYLIEKSKLVITLEGTVGWEAFISKNPVLCLASVAFYALSSCVYTGYDLSTLESDIWNALEKGDSVYREKEEEWLWFIHSVITTVCRGNMVKKKPAYGFDTDSQNTELVASEILRKVKRITSASGKTRTG